MRVVLNGKESEIEDNLTLSDLINSKELNRDRVIVQIDEEIIKKDSYDNLNIKESSRIEILSIVGGG